MLDFLRSKKLAAVIMGIVLLGSIALGVFASHFFWGMNSSYTLTVPIEGEYSIDGGEWKSFDNKAAINETFKKAVFRGKLADEAYYLSNITISAKNVWYTLKRKDGSIISSHEFISAESQYEQYRNDFLTYGEDDEDLPDEYYDPSSGRSYPVYKLQDISFEEYRSKYLRREYFQSVMSDTPGYWVEEIYTYFGDEYLVKDDENVILEVVYPYDLPREEFSDCFSCLISEANGKYTQFFYKMPQIILFIMFCFFGLIFFPVAGFILGKIDYSYLAFGAVCFFWGLFMLIGSVSSFMNMWITDPTVCLLVHKLTNYFFIISILFYLKSNLTRSVTRAVGNVLGIGYLALIILVVILHFQNIADIHATSTYMFIYTAVCALSMTALFCVEILVFHVGYGPLLSWTPLAVCVLIDAVNHYTHFTTINFYYFGIAFTMLYQLVRSLLRLKRQYKEAIRYQQMQKELYEAKVSVMVSQIRPHFMYNALSSIAMLCKLDPETAYQATITFSQYLRQNMDSLKQTTPIPFEQELEHLKKYLYIEKLRFGKKLNIVYDIQTTDFELPQLSIQPLAENAVKHGISKKRGGGTLTIATRETEDAYEVTVSDDGTGFDVNEVKNDGRSHIGMENIRTRLKEMCGAEVTIESKTGEGTVATVRIPKEENK